MHRRAAKTARIRSAGRIAGVRGTPRAIGGIRGRYRASRNAVAALQPSSDLPPCHGPSPRGLRMRSTQDHDSRTVSTQFGSAPATITRGANMESRVLTHVRRALVAAAVLAV